MASNVTERDRMLMRWAALQSERSSWVPVWQKISNQVLPWCGRFFAQERNRGDRRYNDIYDNTGTRSLRILSAGMMAGMTSPARPWFRLTTSDPELDESSNVKMWLSDIANIARLVFAKSNTYRALHSCYEEQIAFGTWAGVVVDSYEDVMHTCALTTGEYALATDYYGRVNVLYREFEITVAQAMEEFGADAVSPTVRNLHERGALESAVRILHVIEPRIDREPSKRDAKNMAWKSVYFEPGAQYGKVLRESGFKSFPALCPRWAVLGGDVYGNSPAMEALGDIGQLQHEQFRKSQGIDYQTKPPLQAPSSLKAREVDTLPGGITYVDAAVQGGGVRTTFEAQIKLDHLLADIQDVRERIRGSFYADLFLMLANSTKDMTATEVAERHEEKLLMLGPVLERQHNELLYPLIDRTFTRMLEAGIVPPPPPELRGMELNVEFVSMLAQAQRAVATNAVDRFVANLGVIAGMKPEVVDKFDPDRWADWYADATGVDPEMIVPGEKVALIRQQRAQAAQAQALADQMEQRANTAAKLAGSDTSGRNALTDVTRAFSGYS